MIDGLLSLILSAEVNRTNLELQQTSDSYAAAILLEKQKTAAPKVTATYTVTYDVSYRGTIQADKEEFRNLVRETLTSPNGWKFLRVVVCT